MKVNFTTVKLKELQAGDIYTHIAREHMITAEYRKDHTIFLRGWQMVEDRILNLDVTKIEIIEKSPCKKNYENNK